MTVLPATIGSKLVSSAMQTVPPTPTKQDREKGLGAGPPDV